MKTLGYLGAVLITTGFTALGISLAARLKRRMAVIASLIGALDYMEAEISYGLVPVDELLAELGDRDRVLGGFWKSVAREWRSGDRLADVWSVQLRLLDMKEQDRMLAEEIGRILGHYDAERQVARLRFVKDQLAYSQAAARDELLKNGRLFCILGALCGLTVAIILI